MTDTMTDSKKHIRRVKINALTPYLLALLDTPKEKVCSKGFVNCYIRCDYDRDEYGMYNKRIYAVYNKSELSVDILEFLSNEPQFLKSLILEDFIILVFVPLQEFLIDFKLLEYGKYSKLSNIFKTRLLTMYALKDGEIDTTKGIFRVLYPTEQHRKIVADKYNVGVDNIKEIKSAPNIIKETFYTSTIYSIDFK